MLNFGVERVVARIPRPIAVNVNGEVRERLSVIDRAVTDVWISCADGRIGRRPRLRYVATHQQMRALRPDVIKFEGSVFGERALRAERPLLDIRVTRFR